MVHTGIKVAIAALALGVCLPVSAEEVAPQDLEKELISQIVAKAGYESASLSSIRVTVPNVNATQLNSIPAFIATIPAERTLDVGAVEMDTTAKQFTAHISLLPEDIGKHPAIEGIILSGRVEPLMEVPVLKRSMFRDDVIRERDVTYSMVPVREVKRQNLTQQNDIIDHMLVKPVSAGQLLSARDVEMPRLVKKGNVVDMVYRTAYMELKTVGQALQDGAKGDLITVKNTQSGKVVNAMVMEDGRLLVNYSAAREQVALTRTTQGGAHSE